MQKSINQMHLYAHFHKHMKISMWINIISYCVYSSGHILFKGVDKGGRLSTVLEYIPTCLPSIFPQAAETYAYSFINYST